MKTVILMFWIICVMSLSVFAQLATPTPSPTPINPSSGDVLLGLLGLVKSWGSIGIYTAIAAALKLLVDATKAFGLFDKIPQAWQSSFVIGVAVLTVGLTVLASGGSLSQAVSASLGSSGMAMLMHEWLDDVMVWVKAKINPTKMEEPKV